MFNIFKLEQIFNEFDIDKKLWVGFYIEFLTTVKITIKWTIYFNKYIAK